MVHVVDRGLSIAINKKALEFSNLKAGPHCLQCCVLHEERNIVERDFVESDFVATSSTLATLYFNRSKKSPKVEHANKS